MKITALLSLLAILLITSLTAQEPPAWVNLGELPYAAAVRDMLEIPGTNTLLACGVTTVIPELFLIPYEARIWKSTNGDQSWSTVLNLRQYGSAPPLWVQLKYDFVSGRIWARRATSGANTLHYSTDNGDNWTGVSTPVSNPPISANAIEIVGDYVYFGGTISNPYSIGLYRLHQTSLEWEMVKLYPECNTICNLKYHNGKLIVFARDKNGTLIRVFSHSPDELDRNTVSLGKASVSEGMTEELPDVLEEP